MGGHVGGVVPSYAQMVLEWMAMLSALDFWGADWQGCENPRRRESVATVAIGDWR
jgi:hypothetical protein